MKLKKDFKGLNIPLVEGWNLLSDPYNIILQSPEGKQYYYSCIEIALDCLIQKVIKRADCKSIAELISYVKSLSEGLSKALEPLKLAVVPITKLNKQEAKE